MKHTEIKMRIILFVIVTLLGSGCVNTEVEQSEIADLKYSTIEIAKVKGDSMVIVTEGYQDYVFLKREGELKLHKKYISSGRWADIPGAIVIFIVILAFVIGLIMGRFNNR